MHNLVFIAIIFTSLVYGHVNSETPYGCDINPNATLGGQIRIAHIGSSLTFSQSPPGQSLEFETLITLSRNGYEPLIAKITNHPAQGKLIIYIHPDAQFHNGEPITSKVVLDNITKHINSLIKRIEVLSKHIIRIRYQGDGDEIIKQLYNTPIIIKKGNKRVGSGPYFTSNVNSKQITYRRISHYWGSQLPNQIGRYNFKQIDYHLFSSTDEAHLAFMRNNIDVYEERINARWATLKNHTEFITLKNLDAPNIQIMKLNTDGILQDQHLQQKLALIFNPDLAPSLFFEYDTSIYHQRYPHASLRETLENISQSLDDQQWLLNAHGVREKNNQQLIITLSPPPKHWQHIIEYWKQVCRQVGIQLVIGRETNSRYDLTLDIQSKPLNQSAIIPLWSINQYRLGLKQHIGFQTCNNMHLDYHRWWYKKKKQSPELK